MSSIASVRNAAMQLDRRERADLARQLIASLDEEVEAADEDVEAAWLAEVERRMLAAEGGTAKFEAWKAWRNGSRRGRWASARGGYGRRHRCGAAQAARA